MKLSDQEKQIHEQFSEYGRNAKEWLQKCQMLLPLVVKYKIWEKKGFGSVYEYAAKLAGMSHSNVKTTLWVMRKIEDKPALMAVAESHGVSAVRPVANVATLEDQDFWAKNAKQMGIHTLEAFVRETKKSCHVATSQPDRLDVTLYLKLDLARRLEQLKKHEKFEEEFERLLVELENRLEREKPPLVKTLSRPVPAGMRRFVWARTSGLCSFPGCLKKATSLHHTQRWALEKIHDPNRLHPVCTDHEHLAHHGLIGNEQGPPHTWYIRKEPDKNSDKFYIDTLVSLYR